MLSQRTSCGVTPSFILLQLFSFFVSLIGVEDLDSSQDTTTHLVSAVASPPPPKNAARMLALALAESAQQGSVPSQSSGLCTPQSPLSSQDATHFQESPPSLFKMFSEGGPVARASSPPLPNNPDSTATPAPSSPLTSSPATQQQLPGLPSDAIRTQTEPDSTLSDPSQCPSSPSVASPIRNMPEQQQCFSGQIPVQTNSSSNTPSSNPSGSCRDSQVLSKPEVSSSR